MVRLGGWERKNTYVFDSVYENQGNWLRSCIDIDTNV